ncbi:hypothetical protein [Actinomadura rubrisoli]|uniref:Uncharacterized protein n=1 Tax=Actinomadura rubrisoli TaxID=2530368 RepID=A0A4R5BRU1_9ACTN|nr:hypothetical protein [Actinomadura rubrisoli]TDD88719.1 hypothetical protein E1298_14915 [Actinomadura rubrisoli]
MNRVHLVALGVPVAVGVGAVAAGAEGALAAATGLAVVAMAAAWLTVVRAPRPQAGHDAPAPDPLAAFVTYRKIESSLRWAGTSQAHYDRIVRPLLSRLLAERLLERRGVDMAARPDLARDIVGPELWPFFDPAAAGAGDDRRRGVGDDVLRRLVERLEET